MQNTHPGTASLSSESYTNIGDQSSSSPVNQENLNLPPPTTRTPLSPSRFIGPLPYVDPAYMRRVDMILRSFPTSTDPKTVYAALKARLGISRSKDLNSTSTPPSPAENMTPSTDRIRQPLEVAAIKDDDGREEVSLLPSTSLLRRREAEWNLFSVIEDDSVQGGIRRGTVDEVLERAEVLRRQIDAKKQAVGAVTEESKADKNAPPQEGRGQRQ